MKQPHTLGVVAASTARSPVGDHSAPIGVDNKRWILDVTVPLQRIVRHTVPVLVKIIHHALHPWPVHAATR